MNLNPDTPRETSNEEKTDPTVAYPLDARPDDHIIGKKSPGVARIEAVSSQLTLGDRIFLFLGVFLVAYPYGLDGTVRYTYQATATSDYALHSLLSTINVLRSVIAAAAQPT